MGWFFATAAATLLTFARSLAQKSKATCSSSFDWAKNNKGQDPCLVAALLQADCRNDTSVTVPQLAVNELYPGPDPTNAHDVCACNSIVYSLLSACAACQHRFYVDWTSWTMHCAIAYIKGFPKNISNDIIVPDWAYNNITIASIPNFDMDHAIKIATSKDRTSEGPAPSQTISGGTTIYTGAQASTVWNQTSGGLSFTTFTTMQSSSEPVSTTSVPTPDNQTGTRKSLMIVGGVVGSVIAAATAFLAIWCLFRQWTRRKAGKPLNGGTIFYRPLVQVEIPHEPTDNKHQPSFTFSPLEMDITTNRHSCHTNNPSASHGYSRIDLPSYLFHTSPDSENPQSPAVESSELFTTVGGHSSSAGHDPGRQNSAQSSTKSVRVNPFSYRRGGSRRSTLLSNHKPSPVRESSMAQGDSRTLA